jgi:hypothetical protein
VTSRRMHDALGLKLEAKNLGKSTFLTSEPGLRDEVIRFLRDDGAPTCGARTILQRIHRARPGAVGASSYSAPDPVAMVTKVVSARKTSE